MKKGSSVSPLKNTPNYAYSGTWERGIIVENHKCISIEMVKIYTVSNGIDKEIWEYCKNIKINE